MKRIIKAALIVLILGVSCKKTNKRATQLGINKNQVVLDSIYQVEKLDSTSTYQPLSLHYKGKPIFTIGQKTTEIDSTFSYRMDPNMDYQGFENLITDYLSTDNYLHIDLGNNSSLNGIVFFSVDKESKRIFNVSASWYFDLNQKNMEQAAIDSITKRIFPLLKGKIQLKKNWTYEHKSKFRVEIFSLKQRERDQGWILNYEVELK